MEAVMITPWLTSIGTGLAFADLDDFAGNLIARAEFHFTFLLEKIFYDPNFKSARCGLSGLSFSAPAG
jgi:hypothetical protein